MNTNSTSTKNIDVIIEISQNSDPIKYEFDKDRKLLIVDRFLPVSMHYPCNYGFIPDTHADDGDPVDVLVYTRFPIIPGTLITARPIGVLLMHDEKGEDVKILAVPTDNVDPFFKDITNYNQLPQIKLSQIEHFFTHYKSLEDNKFVNIQGWKGVEHAEELIKKSMKEE